MSLPEEQARKVIDVQLKDAGWLVQDMGHRDLSASQGIAVSEISLSTGRADYTLFVDGKALGIIEAKRSEHSLTGVNEQSSVYAEAEQWLADNSWQSPLPFRYEANGREINFTDQRDPDPRARDTFGFHRPESLRDFSRSRQRLRMIQLGVDYLYCR